MPETRTIVKNGVAYRVTRNDDGTFSSAPATQGPPMDPTYPHQGPKAAADVTATQTNTVGNQLDNDLKRATASAAKKKAEADARAALATATKAEAEAAAAIKNGKGPDIDALNAARAEALRRLALVQSLSDRSHDFLATGFGSNVARMFGGTTATDVEADVGTLSGAGALQTIIDMSAANGGKNPLTPLSEGDVKMIRESVTNLDPNQSDVNFRKNLGTYEDIYGRALQGVDAQLAAAGAPVPQAPPPPGFDGGGPSFQQAQGAAYSTPADMRITNAVYGAMPQGLAAMIEAARANDYEPSPGEVARWRQSIDEGKRRGVRPGIAPLQRGQRGQAAKQFGKFAASPLGSFGIGAANTVSMGALDEMTGAINSLGSGNSMADEIAYADFGKRASAEANPGSYLGGQLFGGFTQGAAALKAFPGLAGLNTFPRIAGAGAAYGGTEGAFEGNADRLGSAGLGVLAGVGGAGAGRYVAAPLIDRLMRTGGGQAVSGAVRDAINRFSPGKVAPTSNVPAFAPGERVLPDFNSTPMQGPIGNLRDADRLGLPYALADADPKLRMLAGSVARKSPSARELAENTFEPRARGQADRAREGIDQRLAPITDIEQRKSELFKAGNIASDPYYALADSQPAVVDDEIAAFLSRDAGKDALRRARQIASNEGRNPEELGFTVDDAGNVGLVPQPGRFERATAPNERGDLTRKTVRGYYGNSVPVAGPIDMLGFLRLRGGLRDNAGELKTFDMNNAGRSKLDFVGQEAKFGPIVNPQGMSFDDAANAAWEAGYFPELTERPDISQFLDSVRDHQFGQGRRFLPEDAPEIERFNRQREERYGLQEQRFVDGETPWTDNSQPAGFNDRQYPPASAYGEKEVSLPTFKTLDLVKKGLDARINEARDPFGNINFTGDPQLQAIEGLRKDFVSKLDRMNSNYPKARAEYAKYAKRADALDQGLNLTSANLPQRRFDSALGKAAKYDGDFRQDGDRLMPEMQRGYATGMADQVGKMRLSANPYDAIYGSPNQQARVGALFPQGAADFGRQYDLERDMAKTMTETLGGSQTAPRQAADEMFDNNLGMAAVDLAGAVATGGVPVRSMLQLGWQGVKDNWRLKGGQKRANSMAPLLFNPDPRAVLNYIDDLGMRQVEDMTRKQAFRRRSGLFGAAAAPVLLGSE